MKSEINSEPREFDAGAGHTIRDWGSLIMDADDLISLRGFEGGNIEVTAKEWGFYLGTSLNQRMKNEGFRAALVLNATHNKVFIMAVYKNRTEEFKNYLSGHYDQKILCWLDDWVQT